MIGFMLWCLLFVVCWPLALLALVLWPLVWLLSLPFRLLGIGLEAVFSLLRAVLMLPARVLGGRVKCESALPGMQPPMAGVPLLAAENALPRNAALPPLPVLKNLGTQPGQFKAELVAVHAAVDEHAVSRERPARLAFGLDALSQPVNRESFLAARDGDLEGVAPHTTGPAKDCFIDLSEVHTAWYPQRVQYHIHRCSIFEERHIFLANDLSHNTFVTMTTCHLITYS